MTAYIFCVSVIDIHLGSYSLGFENNSLPCCLLIMCLRARTNCYFNSEQEQTVILTSLHTLTQEKKRKRSRNQSQNHMFLRRQRNKQKGEYMVSVGKIFPRCFFLTAVQSCISIEMETSEHRSWVQGHALQLFHCIYSEKGPLPSGIPGCTVTVLQHEGQLWPTGNQRGIHRHQWDRQMPSCKQHCKIKTSKQTKTQTNIKNKTKNPQTPKPTSSLLQLL